MAPQQPAPSATTVWMPAASSTRAVALLILGAMAGCTQPSSKAALRFSWRVGQSCAVAGGLAGTLSFNDAGTSGRKTWPSFMAGLNSGEVSPSFNSQRTRFSVAGRSTLASTTRRPMSTRRPYSTPDGQVVSQLRQVRQRSRWSCVSRVGAAPSSTCLIR